MGWYEEEVTKPLKKKFSPVQNPAKRLPPAPKPPSALEELQRSWARGQGIKLINEGYRVKWEENNPALGEELIRRGQALVEANQPTTKHVEIGPGIGGVLKTAVTPEFYTVNLAEQIPLMADITKKKFITGVSGTALEALGAALTAATLGVGAEVGMPMMIAGASLRVAGGAEAAREEAAMEAADTYQQVYIEKLKAGETAEKAHEYAKKAADKTYKANLAGLSVTNLIEQFTAFGVPLHIASKAADIAKRTGKLYEVGQKVTQITSKSKAIKPLAEITATGATESAEELGQYIIQQKSQGKPIDLSSQEAKQSMLGGAIMGGGMATAGHIATAPLSLLGKGEVETEQPTQQVQAVEEPVQPIKVEEPEVPLAIKEFLKEVGLDPDKIEAELKNEKQLQKAPKKYTIKPKSPSTETVPEPTTPEPTISELKLAAPEPVTLEPIKVEPPKPQKLKTEKVEFKPGEVVTNSIGQELIVVGQDESKANNLKVISPDKPDFEFSIAKKNVTKTGKVAEVPVVETEAQVPESEIIGQEPPKEPIVTPKEGGYYKVVRKGKEYTGTVTKIYKTKSGAVLANLMLDDGKELKGIPVSKYATWHPLEREEVPKEVIVEEEAPKKELKEEPPKEEFKEEVAKEEVAEASKEEPKKEVIKEEKPKKEAKEEEPKKEAKEEPKEEVAKEKESKKEAEEEVKEKPREEVAKEEPKKEVAKEEEPKKEEIKEEITKGEELKEKLGEFYRDDIISAFNAIKSEWEFVHETRKRRYRQEAKIWEKYGRFRIYVPRDEYEQAGYITFDEADAKGKRIGEYKGIYYSATRPGNVDKLIKFIDDLLNNLPQKEAKIKTEEQEGAKASGRPAEEVLGQANVERPAKVEPEERDTGVREHSTEGPGRRSAGLPGEHGGETSSNAHLQQGETGVSGRESAVGFLQETNERDEGRGGEEVNDAHGGLRSEVRGEEHPELHPAAHGEVPGGGRGEEVLGEPAVAIGVAENYIINEENPVFTKGGKKTRYKANIEAIKVMDRCLTEGRLPTQEEKRQLALFSGWGDLSEVFDYAKDDWKKERAELRDLLHSIKDKHFSNAYLWDEARASTKNAHYTSPEIISVMYDILLQLGIKSGHVLEPSCGIGNFFGMLPENLRGNVKLHGVEIDPITGTIAQLLYPNANIQIKGFQDIKYPDNFFDVVIGNVPFGNYPVYDNTYSKVVTDKIHNYFIVKSIDKAKPKGIVAVITSTGFLDSPSNEAIRKIVAMKAKFLGAVRLPSETFKENAGTEVTTDIVFFQKYAPGEYLGMGDWIASTPQEYEGQTLYLNEYYVKNKDMVIGELTKDKLTGDRFGATTSEKEEIPDKARELLSSKLPKNIVKDSGLTDEDIAVLEIEGDNRIEGTLIIDNDKVFRKIDDEYVEVKGNVEEIKQLINIKELLKTVLRMQRQLDVSEEELERARADLRKAYEDYVAKYKNLLVRKTRVGKLYGKTRVEEVMGFAKEVQGKGKPKKVFITDPDVYLLKSLELEEIKIDKDGNEHQTITPSEILFKRTFTPRKPITKVNSAEEGLIASINTYGRIDLDYISKIYRKDEKEVIKELGDRIYKNPTGDWELAEKYLSGNVRQKLKEAQQAIELDQEYQRNIEALEKVIPKDIPLIDISLHLGDEWIPIKITKEAILKLLGLANPKSITLSYNPHDASWKIKSGKYYYATPEGKSIRAGLPYTELEIINMALNNKPETVKYKNEEGKQVIDIKATNMLRAKVKEIRNYMKEFLYEHPEYAEEVERLYNEKFNCYVPENYEKLAESYKIYGINPNIQLRPHQKRAVIRSITSGNTLLAHVVGAGKTYEQIIIAMESKRLGLASKPLLVVPNHKLSDFEYDAKTLYPGCNILVLDENDFKSENIKRTLALAALNSWDFVVIRHSSFTKIPVTPETMTMEIRREIEEYHIALEEARASGDRISVKNIETALAKLRVKLERLTADAEKYKGMLCFEDLGFDMILVDEAHKFKNLPLAGRVASVKGMHTGSSERAFDMMVKLNYIRKINGGNRGVVFATGTPITNSMAEVYIMTKYLRPDLLEAAGVKHFDAWAKVFTNLDHVTEIAPSGGFRVAYKFESFVNLPELIMMYRQFADIVGKDDVNLPIPKHDIVKVECAPHPKLGEVMQMVQSKWESAIANGTVLRLFNIVRNAPLDMKLVDPEAEDFAGSKINRVVDNVVKIYKEKDKEKATQLVFLSVGQSSITGANLWEEIKNKLVTAGIPENEIAYVKTGTKEEELDEIYRKTNAGQIRVLIGSYNKLGEGVNVQERLYAIHEVMPPYRPAEIEQAEGRILRQGNSYYNKKEHVKIFRYVTVGEEGSFSGDAYSWQLIEDKLKGINAMLKGDTAIRKLAAFDADAYDAATMKAIAIGDERWLTKVNLEKEIDEITGAYNSFLARKMQAAREINRLNNELANARDLIGQAKFILQELEETKGKYISIDSKKYNIDEKEDLANTDKVIKAQIKKLEKKYRHKDTDSPVELTDFNSIVKLRYIQHYSPNLGILDQYIFISSRIASLYSQFRMLLQHRVDLNESEPRYLSGSELSISSLLRRDLKNLPMLIEREEERVNAIKQQIEKNKEISKQEFSRKAELDEKKKQLMELNIALGIGEFDVSNEEEAQPPENSFRFADSTAEKATSRVNSDFNIPRNAKDRFVYAPDAWNKEEFILADKVATELTGGGIVPVKIPKFLGKIQGFFNYETKKIFINTEAEDPITFVALHEAAHKMSLQHPEHFEKLKEIAVKHLKEEHSELIAKYRRRGYTFEEMPEEFTADLLAELLHDRSFIQRIKEKAPTAVSKLVQVLEDLITRIKLIFSDEDESVLQYIENIEALKDELAVEYANYLTTVQQQKQSIEEYRRSIAAKKPDKIVDLAPVKGISYKTKGPAYTFSNPEIEAEYQASVRVNKFSLKEYVREVVKEIVKSFTTEFKHLPRKPEFAILRYTLLYLQKQKSVRAQEAIEIIEKIVGDMTPEEFDLFCRKVILDDLAHEAQRGHDLPYGFDTETLFKDKQRLDQTLKNYPKILRAVAARKIVWEQIRHKYIDVFKQVGVDMSDRFTNKDYYRHDVLNYASQKRIWGAGRKLKTPLNRSYQKKREGSTSNINRNYLEAEYEVMAQMLLDIEIAKTIKVVKDNYDISDTLKKMALELNEKNFMSLLREELNALNPAAEPETIDNLAKKLLKELNKKQATALSKLAKLAAKGELPAGPNGKFQPVIDYLAQMYFNKTLKVATIQQDLMKYISWLASNPKSKAERSAALYFLKGMNEKKRLIREKLGDKYVTWRDLIPEGYTTYQPREGSMFFMANSIPAKLAEELFSQGLESIGVSKNDVRKVLARGQRFPELVVKQEVADTLNNLNTYNPNVIEKALQDVTGFWKIYQLISPFRWLKYNVRNITGDVDAALAGNPSALKKLPRAWNELYSVIVKGEPMSRDLRDWFERGGMQSLMQAQEIYEVNNLRKFKHLMDIKEKKGVSIFELPKNAWLKYWDTARITTDFREALLRYATYLDYLEQMKENNGVPRNFGASDRDSVMALSDIRDRAYALSNELIGAYDEVSVAGQWLREHLIPFYSFQEVNIVRYKRMLVNAYIDGRTCSAIAGKVTGMAIRSPLIAYNIGKFIIKACMLWAIIQTWNLLKYPDEEKELPDEIKGRPHIILGRDKDGNIRYFSRLGALSDLLDWVGVDAFVTNYIDYLNGRRTIKEIVVEMAKSPVNKIVQSITPFIKTPVELLTKEKLYPDVFKPKTIYDPWLYLFQSYGMEAEYRKLKGLPSRPYKTRLEQLVFEKADPKEQAYYYIIDERNRFMRKLGKGNVGFMVEPNAKSTALYNFKLALKYGDMEAARKYFDEYTKAGGTPRGLKQSLMALHPLYGLNNAEARFFVQTLSQRDRERLLYALEYYQEVISGGK